MNKWVLGIVAGIVVIGALLWLGSRFSLFRPAPRAQILVRPLTGRTPLGVSFALKEKISDDDGVQCEWTIDGTTVSTRRSFRYRFLISGQHTVMLKVTTASGASSTDTVTIPVRPFLWWSREDVGDEGGDCIMLDEPADAAEWTGNYLCSMEHFGLRWSAAGPIAGMRCTQISEPEEPAQHGWEDNYLCLPESSPLELRWSASGPIAGLDCTHFNPPRNPHGWKNNFLCYSRQLQTEAQQPVGQ